MNSTHTTAPHCFPDSPFIWRDLSWPERQPVVRVEPYVDNSPSGEIVSIPLPPGSVLNIRLLAEDEDNAGLWCSGFAHGEFDVDARPSFRTVPCPQGNRITKGQQCRLCMHLDKFRPIHRAHRGAELSEVARAYIGRPHWLYVATFPDGTSKVGTAHERSKVTRLDQQAVARASYVALADDGLEVRRLEDAVTQTVKLTQLKRVSAKYKAWLNPEDPEELTRIHDQIAATVREELSAWDDSSYRVVTERWTPGGAMLRAYEQLGTTQSRPLQGYEAWTSAPRRFLVDSGTGPFLSGCAENDPDTAGWLLNTAVLKNRMCAVFLGDDGPVSFQDSLF